MLLRCKKEVLRDRDFRKVCSCVCVAREIVGVIVRGSGVLAATYPIEKLNRQPYLELQRTCAPSPNLLESALEGHCEERRFDGDIVIKIAHRNKDFGAQQLRVIPEDCTIPLHRFDPLWNRKLRHSHHLVTD